MEKQFELKIWKWDDAPEIYRELSRHGGDEDLVLEIYVNNFPQESIWYLPNFVQQALERETWIDYGISGNADYHEFGHSLVVILAHA